MLLNWLTPTLDNTTYSRLKIKYYKNFGFGEKAVAAKTQQFVHEAGKQFGAGLCVVIYFYT